MDENEMSSTDDELDEYFPDMNVLVFDCRDLNESFQERGIATDGNEKYKCDWCSETFNRRSQLEFHVKYKHSKSSPQDAQSPHRSPQGDKSLDLDKQSDVKQYQNDAKDKSAKDYKCSKCSYQTNHKGNFKVHLKIHGRSYQCDICKKKFTQQSHLNKHIANIHVTNGSAKELKCSECSYETKNKHHLKRHMNTHTGIKPFQCDICMIHYASKDYLEKHIKKKHKHINNEPKNKKQTENGNAKHYKCTKCSYKTKYKSNWYSHIKTHGIKPFQCDICMSKFTFKGGLKTHIKFKHIRNEVEKDYKCSKCSYQTHYGNDLKKHMNIHSGIKPYKCDICKIEFGRNDSLRIHIKNKHSANEHRTYKCSECTFQTIYEQVLSRHMYTHSGIKPYECGICTNKFSRKHRLAEHIKMKHPKNVTDKDYKCLECSYKTNYKQHLKRHMKAHTGIKKFHCDICMSKFTTRAYLKKHIKRQHIKN